MVLSYLITRFIVNPEDISPSFNVTVWNEQNPDFYVLPHPLLYLVFFKPWQFLSVCLINLFLPEAASHVSQIVILAGSLLLSPLEGLSAMPSFAWKVLYKIAYYAFKSFEWSTLIDLMYRAHVIFTQHNVYFWILNHLNFGILASWPMLRPDLFEEYQQFYCIYWSC